MILYTFYMILYGFHMILHGFQVIQYDFYVNLIVIIIIIIIIIIFEVGPHFPNVASLLNINIFLDFLMLGRMTSISPDY